MLAWWRHAAPRRAALRVILVRRGDELLGVAPFFVDRGYGGLARYRFLAAGTSMRVEPLACPGAEGAVAGAFARALSLERPGPDVLMFEGVDSASPWPALFAAALHGAEGPWVHRDVERPAPILPLEGRTFEQWMASRSRNFRSQMRRACRRLEARGATFLTVDPADAGSVAEGVRSFAGLHRSRWDPRGGSAVLKPGVERMIEAAAPALGPSRFRLQLIVLDGRPISAHVFVAAGGEVSYWLGGFDGASAREHPSMLSLLAALEGAWGQGDVRFDFGGGAQPYKFRFAEGEDLLRWVTLVPRDGRYARARLGLVPKHAYRFVSDRLPESTRERFRRAVPGSDWIR